MKKIHLITNLLICISASASFSCVRSDLPDRTPAEALKKSVNLAKTLDPGKVTVLISCLDENQRIMYEGSGVAIDPYTILTAAHVVYGKYSKISTTVSVGINGINEVTLDIKEKIIHPEFSPSETKTAATKKPKLIREDGNGSYEIFLAEYRSRIDYDQIGAPVNISAIREMTLEELTSTDCLRVEATKNDLAILKLGTPLPKDLPYPQLSTIQELNDQDGVSIGWGIPTFNRQLEDTAETRYDPTKHLISCKVNTTLKHDEKILYALYKGLLVNGCRSFIPDNTTMMKTIGLPVHGDSGGGVFIKPSNDPDLPYVLAGIQSQIFCLYINEIKDPHLRDTLATVEQPIYPIWTDITHHTKWITENRA